MNLLKEISILVSSNIEIIVNIFKENIHKQFVDTFYINEKVNFINNKYFSYLNENDKKIIYDYFNFYKNNNPLINIFINQYRLFFNKKIEITDISNIINLITSCINFYNYYNIDNVYNRKLSKYIVTNILKIYFINLFVFLCKDLDENKIIDIIICIFTLIDLEIKPINSGFLKCF